jgi:hypothetical protein
VSRKGVSGCNMKKTMEMKSDFERRYLISASGASASIKLNLRTNPKRKSYYAAMLCIREVLHSIPGLDTAD